MAYLMTNIYVPNWDQEAGLIYRRHVGAYSGSRDISRVFQINQEDLIRLWYRLSCSMG